MERTQGPQPDRRPTGRSATRPLAETLILLFAGMLVVRTFAAEAYIVPTGSMAPTLLGIHRDITCAECGFLFALGVDEEGRAGRAVCPNCGSSRDDAAAVERTGDRLLVQKHLYDWRSPRRWEVVVFLNPNEPSQAYVKRVVGLPGESVEIRGGDVYIDGRIAPKGIDEVRGMRLLVHDSRFRPPSDGWFPRWTFVPDGAGPSGWHAEQGGGYRHRSVGGSRGIDWLEYQHVDPDRASYGAVRDFVAYNGARIGSDRRVPDLMLEADLDLSVEVGGLALRFGSGADRLLVRVPLDGRTPPEADHAGRTLATDDRAARLAAPLSRRGGTVRLEASCVDRRLYVLLDGEPLFEPLDLPPPDVTATPVTPDVAPLALGLIGGEAVVHRLRVYRDIYYTDSDGFPRPGGDPAHGVGAPYRLGDGEYFVLGDNSPVSNDSRFWPEGPVVRDSMLLGKPFLVHLPSRAVPLRVLGGEPYWVPDLRAIRYIR